MTVDPKDALKRTFAEELRQAIFDCINRLCLDPRFAGLSGAELSEVAGFLPGDSSPRVRPADPATVCDLCGGQGPLFLHARCHLTAPLAAELDGDTLVLRCYVPECGREVARFKIVR